MACVSLLICSKGSAQVVDIGLLSSPKSVGFSFRHLSRNQNLSVVRLSADILDVLSHKHDNAGIKCDYAMLMPLTAGRIGEDTQFSVMAGPGASVGYVADHGTSKGHMCGLMGAVCIDFAFKVPVHISLSANAILGCHITKDGKTLEFYKNCIYRSWIPEITIYYRF